MKTKVFAFLCFISFFSCSDDENKPQENSIIGSWKLVEVYGSDGTEGQWTNVENGYTYTFTESNALISNRFSCNGNFSVDSDSLTIGFDCDENQFNMSSTYSFEDRFLVIYPDNCDEGCAEKYERIGEN